MTYTAEISRANPGCFLFLVDQSGSMDDPFAAGKRKADGVADAINRLLQNLVIKCTKSEGVRDYFEVGVIGYGLNVGPAFSGALAGRNLVSVSQVASHPARMDQRTRKVEDGAGGVVEQEVKFPIWFDPVANGPTPMSQALELAYTILSTWIGAHSASYPPVVINITDAGVTDAGEKGDPVQRAQALMNLNTQDGNLLVLNCHISSREAVPVLFPNSEGALPDELARLLFRMSSVLPNTIREAARNEGFQVGDQARGFAFNADLVDIIRFLDIGTRPSSQQLR
jgi:hypothetical protein